MSDDSDNHTGSNLGWKFFNLAYLGIYFTGWFWQPVGSSDVLAIVVAIAVFMPIYFHAFERSAPAFIPHIIAMELICWALLPFAGVHGVFHVYACVQSAFQRPARRALVLIGSLTAAYIGYASLRGLPLFQIGFDVMFGLLIGIACIAGAEGIEREGRLRRSRVLERQRATLAERERIAHDLHDLLGHTLTMVALKSELASKLMTRDPERARGEIADVADAARNALKDIRAAVYDMTATTVDTEIALARNALDAAGVTLEVVNNLPDITPPMGKALGLTIREATTNIVRHSRADAARIDIDRQDGRLQLSVSDNGVADERSASEGAGLAGLRQRIAALGGETTIRRQQGMQILVSLPLNAGAGPGATA